MILTEKEKKQIRKQHKNFSIIKEQEEKPCVGIECSECLSCAEESLVGENPLPVFGGSFDYRPDATEVTGEIMKVMTGEIPNPADIAALWAKLAWKFPKIAMDGPIIMKNMYDNGCFEVCVPDIDLGDFFSDNYVNK